MNRARQLRCLTVSTVRVCGASLLSLLLTSACHRLDQPLSAFNVADPRAAGQLISGFWGVEARPSRWTTRAFSFALESPEAAGQRGGKFWIHLYIPDSEIAAIGPMTLYAKIDDYTLEPETFTSGGGHVYSRAVPAEVLDTNAVPIRCSFDRAEPPSSRDRRELGAVLIDVGLKTN
jgi:hypothetical protein